MKQNAIIWPKEWLPGECDNFASNEIIVKNLDYKMAVLGLVDTTKWQSYYKNCDNIVMLNQDEKTLKNGTKFKFNTFGFEVFADVMEFSSDEMITRVAWHGYNKASGDEFLDVYHAWLIEKLDGNRVRILTQETQNGTPAKILAKTLPNPMINGHQEWLNGLKDFAGGAL